ncbi:MAG: Asp23/Gls24 family envelope stress response protein [Clostridia bacterium]|nr:Asp23/Gls24 family envelope stress response protein [Clostridia bacterium]MDE6868094.1 Asp23/Gls24 family envelope stress response protein [Clostridia bacterium]MDE7265344.1 Asp23/Gls24 family envelope stress response protein [Clostridia bacterium]
MAHIRHDPTSTQKGKITYNSGIVSGIVSLAIEEVDGVSLLNTKNRGIKLNFDKQGIIADISVKVDATYNVPSLAFRIQQSIKHNVESMTKYKVAKVDVHIQDVNFPENSAL